MSDTPTPDEAIAIVAEHLVWTCVENSKDTGSPGWEDYPEIGQVDWYAVLDKADNLLKQPQQDAVEAAVKVLAARAGEVA